VYTSALQRCVVTGTMVANACGVRAVPLEGLMDIDYGAWQMRSHAEIEAEAPQVYRRWKTAPQRVRFPMANRYRTWLRERGTCCAWCWSVTRAT